jgi:arylsulfatase A
VYYPGANNGLNQSEITIAEMLKPAGYRTAIIGKWHLGDRPQFLPTKQGFDSYFGIPFSNDMWIHKDQKLADDIKLFNGFTVEDIRSGKARKTKKGRARTVPLMRGEEVIEFPVDQCYITERYTDEAIKIIDEANEAKKPFFIYLAHAMPHVPLYASPKFAGKSARGPYGDTIEEMDFHIGRLVDHLKKLGIDKNTMLIFTSDNGPWKLGERGGSAAPLRGAKFSSYEGGPRVPCIMWWPETIPAGTVSKEVTTSLDIFPTFAALANTSLPSDRIYDGHDISAMLKAGSKGKSQYEKYFYWNKHHIEALRMGNMKLRWAWDKKNKARKAVELYNLEEDISESNNLASELLEQTEFMSKILLQEENKQLQEGKKK